MRYRVNKLKIKYFNNDDLIEKIINYFKTNSSKEDDKQYQKYKFYISESLFNYLPKENLNEIKWQNNIIFKNYKEIRNIYKILVNNNIKSEELETKYDLVWSVISTFFFRKSSKNVG